MAELDLSCSHHENCICKARFYCRYFKALLGPRYTLAEFVDRACPSYIPEDYNMSPDLAYEQDTYRISIKDFKHKLMSSTSGPLDGPLLFVVFGCEPNRTFVPPQIQEEDLKRKAALTAEIPSLAAGLPPFAAEVPSLAALLPNGRSPEIFIVASLGAASPWTLTRPTNYVWYLLLDGAATVQVAQDAQEVNADTSKRYRAWKDDKDEKKNPFVYEGHTMDLRLRLDTAYSLPVACMHRIYATQSCLIASNLGSFVAQPIKKVNNAKGGRPFYDGGY